MLKVAEFLNIEKIEKLRKKYLCKGLDEFDNFSYHAALLDGDKLLGTGRFYKKDTAIVIDKIAVKGYGEYYEMLFRALLLKASSQNCKYIVAEKEREKEFYLKFNFDDEFKVKPDKITFPACKTI